MEESVMIDLPSRMAWLITVVAWAWFVTLFRHVIFAPAANGLGSLRKRQGKKHTSFGTHGQVCLDSLEQDVQRCHMSCIRETLLEDAGKWLPFLALKVAVGTYFFFAISNTMTWLITKKALYIW
jgi:hypothetical protein